MNQWSLTFRLRMRTLLKLRDRWGPRAVRSTGGSSVSDARLMITCAKRHSRPYESSGSLKSGKRVILIFGAPYLIMTEPADSCCQAVLSRQDG